MPAVLRLDERLVKKSGEIIHVSVGPENHVSTASTIAAIRPAFRHEFLPPKTDAPAPAVARLRKNFDPIDKHCRLKLPLHPTYVIPSGARDLTVEVRVTQ